MGVGTLSDVYQLVFLTCISITRKFSITIITLLYLKFCPETSVYSDLLMKTKRDKIK